MRLTRSQLAAIDLELLDLFFNEVVKLQYNFETLTIFKPTINKKTSSTIKSTLVRLVAKYYSALTILPRSKSTWFKRDIKKYNTFTIDSLRKWLIVAKRILKKSTEKATTKKTKQSKLSILYHRSEDSSNG